MTTQIKVSVKRIASVAPYETVTVDLGVEQDAVEGEKLLAQISRLQAGLRQEADRAIETWQEAVKK